MGNTTILCCELLRWKCPVIPGNWATFTHSGEARRINGPTMKLLALKVLDYEKFISCFDHHVVEFGKSLHSPSSHMQKLVSMAYM